MSAGSPRWPRVGLGCASLGAPALSDRDAEEVIATAVELGIRFFDVAPLYGGGLAEQRLGRVLRHLPRREFFLCTKTGVTRPFGQSAMPPGASRRRAFDVWDYSPQATRASIAHSLERLGVDRLDVVHLHDVEDHLNDCLEAYGELTRLRDEGIVEGIGIGSNLVAPVQRLLAQRRFDAFLLAGCYTLLIQEGAALFDAAARNGIGVIAGGVFNSGVLATWPHAAPTFGYEPAPPDILERTARIGAICQRYNTPIGAAALQFVLAHPGVTTVLIGPRSVAELKANLEAIRHPVPDALWADLAQTGILPSDSPQPKIASASVL